MNRPKLTYVGPSLRRRDGLFYDPRIGRFCGPFPSADATAVRLSVQRGTAQAWGLTDGCGGAFDGARRSGWQVRNTQYLLAADPSEGASVSPIQFAAYCSFPSRFYSLLFAAFGLILRLLAPTAAGRSILKRVRSLHLAVGFAGGAAFTLGCRVSHNNSTASGSRSGSSVAVAPPRSSSAVRPSRSPSTPPATRRARPSRTKSQVWRKGAGKGGRRAWVKA